MFVKSVSTTSKKDIEANSVLVKTDLDEELQDDVHEEGRESEVEAVSYNVIAKNSSTLLMKKSRATSTSSSSRRTCDNVH